jgi:uncharacterized phage protein gp47/JayE
VRFGISILYFAFERAARLGFVDAAPDAGAGRFCAATVLMRAMSRRTCRTREVFSSCPVAR